MRRQVDLQEAVNAVSDVVQNRPRPIRDFDQIHMKVGDMVMQSEIVADWAEGRRLAFIGDGDAISVCVAYLNARKVLDFGPTRITVFDFDERTVQSVKRFADKERIEHLDAQLYNVLDPFPDTTQFHCFYTNPPWGASNEGESVNVFVDRGIEAIRGTGEGMIVIADDDERAWPKVVLANVQRHASRQGFFVSRMQRKLHQYHPDDDPALRSCNLFITSLPDRAPLSAPSQPIAVERLSNFYGMAQPPKVRYVRERKKPDYVKAPDEEYYVEYLDGEKR